MKRAVLMFFISTFIFSLYAQEIDSIIDIRDDQVYKVVKIGQQWWMQENLNIGIRIDGTQDAADNVSVEKYCYDDLESNCGIYGGLYQWDETMGYNPSDSANPGKTRGICPFGWHLPTENEWTELTDFLGGLTVAGGKLKEAGTAHWNSPNEGATNESGFTALPGGYRKYDDSFNSIGYYGYWWSSTEESSTHACYRYMNNTESWVYVSERLKSYGKSVRCLRDSCRFSYLTISDENLNSVYSLNFYGDDVRTKLIIINSNAGEAVNISSM